MKVRILLKNMVTVIFLFINYPRIVYFLLSTYKIIIYINNIIYILNLELTII